MAPLDALITTLREVIAPALAAADDARLLDSLFDTEDFAASRDFGGNQDDAYEAGERAGVVKGRASLARDVLALLDAAVSDEEPSP